MTWRPIETAPIDGSRIVLFCPNLAGPKEAIARWNKIGPRDGFPWEEDSTSRIAVGQPTHWMPLPEPPTTGEQDEA